MSIEELLNNSIKQNGKVYWRDMTSEEELKVVNGPLVLEKDHTEDTSRKFDIAMQKCTIEENFIDVEAIEVEEPGGSTPSQYALPPGAKELIDLIEHRHMNFSIGNIFKAAYRMGSCNHADKLYDLRKIIFFAQRELDKELKVKM
jgi:hypothetical protein